MEKYSSEEFIDNYIKNSFNLKLLDRICKKIDVVKSVKKFYTKDFEKTISEEEISNKHYIKLLNILIDTSEFKTLNSALKLNEILFHLSIIDFKKYLINVKIIEGGIDEKLK